MLFKSFIKIKIQFESRLHYIDIIAYHCTVVNHVCLYREGKLDVLRDLCLEHKNDKALYLALKSKVTVSAEKNNYFIPVLKKKCFLFFRINLIRRQC